MSGRWDDWERDELARIEALFAAGEYRELANGFCHEGAREGVAGTVSVCSVTASSWETLARELLYKARQGELGC